MTRHLIAVVDGTLVSASQVSEFQSYSNVYELAYMLQLNDRSEDGKPQIIFYTSGISSQPGTKDLFSAATGYSIKAQILDQYTNLCSNYDFGSHPDPERRDKIYLFGFSRGAMAVRALAGLIMEYGLLRPNDIRYAPRIVNDWEDNQDQPGYVELVPVDVEFLGVFDSVMGGIERLNMFNPIKFPHNRLSWRCRNGVHLLAMDEDRRFFRNRSWTSHELGEGERGMQQIWMPGVHSDVGGTAGEFWGRASLLTMAYFIDERTQLRLDRNAIARKWSNLAIDLRLGTYRILQHRRLAPFRIDRTPLGGDDPRETLHPIGEMISDGVRYNRSKNFRWREKVRDKRFGDIPVNQELQTHFETMIAAHR
jgi:uncharacterized protein (DUF2235 family)